MPFNRPTLKEITSRVTADFKSRLALAGGVLRRSVIAVLARVIAGAVHGLYGYIDYLSLQFFADTAQEYWLLRIASLYGINRKAAQFAAGNNVVFTGTDGKTIPEGTLLRRSDGVEFVTTADGTIAAGEAIIPVQAVLADTEAITGNTDSGVQLSLISPIAGVDSSATIQGDGITGGIAQEGIESVRQRLLKRLRQPPHGGAKHDYEQWALEIAGVTRAWVYPNLLGPGTVGVTFVEDGNNPIIPNGTKVTEVQDYLETVKPVTADVTVFPPTTLTVDFMMTISPNTVAVQNAVEAQLKDLFERVGEPGATVYLSKIGEAISLADGEDYHTLNLPATDVTTASNQIPIVGSITWL